ncbi:MAG: hypothetical protein ACMUIU_01100 [bacterium]
MKKSVRRLVIISFFLIIIFFGLFKVVNFDFGWHLKTGEYIYTSKSIPKQDIFSYIAAGNKWIDSHWLFQLVLYLFYSIGGTNGVVLLRILVLLLAFGFLFYTIYRQEYFLVSILISIFALFISFQRFLLRPEIFTFLFLTVFFYFTERFSKHPRLSLVIIPLCQIVWANMHGLYVLGIIFLLFYLLGDLFQMLLSRYISVVPKVEISPGEWKQKGVLFCLTCIASLINANGKDGILYPYKIFYELRTKTTVFSRVTELISPFSAKHLPFPDPSIIYKIFLALSVLAIICNIKRFRLGHILPYGAFMYLSFLAIRNMPLFAIIATPVTIKNINDILDFLRKKTEKWPLARSVFSLSISSCFILFAVFVCVFIANNGIYKRLNYLRTFGIGESDYYPSEAVNYLKDKDIEGNIFNSSDIGGYLIWKIYPRKQVSLDGRWEVYGDFVNNIQYLQSPLYFTQLTAKYNIHAIILHKRSWEIQLMGPWLQRSPYWRLTKNTNNAIVFERYNF